MSSWRTVRVFISSTFRDMHAERDQLVRVVFPELRQRLLPFRVHLDDIDLRWGVTREQADNDRALDLCLVQIDECRPFFVGLLGQRYGWVPTQLPPDALGRFGWLCGHQGKSITELEILHGALNDPAMHKRAFFYFRDPAALDDVPEPIRTGVYRDTDVESIRQLASLKERIRRSGYPGLDAYHATWEPGAERLGDLSALGQRVCEDLWDAVRHELGLVAAPAVAAPADPRVEETDDHERFLEERLRAFVGRDAIHEALAAYADGSTEGPCLVVGRSGSGKTGTLAHFVSRYRAARPGARVVAHFVGAGQRSTTLRDLLQRLCMESRDLAGLGPISAFPEDHDELVQLFRAALAGIPASARAVLVIDALDQLEPDDRPYDLHWLPPPGQWPRGARLVMSCLEESEAGAEAVGALGGRPHQLVTIPPLTDAERREILRLVPSLAAKAFDDGQVRRLLTNPATANPLFLRVALEELRGFGSFEQLDDRIAALPSGDDAVGAVFAQVIARLEREHNPTIVRDVLTLLVMARRGLSDRELYELVAGATPGDTPLYASVAYRAEAEGLGDLFAVLRQLRPYLIRRRELNAPYHRSLRDAVAACYLAEPADRDAVHRRLAGYFSRLDLMRSITEAKFLRNYPTREAFDAADQAEILAQDHERFLADLTVFVPRKVDELPWHFAQLADWRSLADTLADLSFLMLASLVNKAEVESYWGQIEAGSSIRLEEAYREVIADPAPSEEGPWRVAADVAQLLTIRGRPAAALHLWDKILPLWQRSGKVAEVLAVVCTARGVLLRELGDADGALAAHRAAESLYQQAGVLGQAAAADRLDTLLHRANALVARGDLDEAMALLVEQERLCRLAGQRQSLCGCLNSQGLILRRRGRPDEALARFREAEQIGHELGYTHGLAAALTNQGIILRDMGDLPAAEAQLEEAEQVGLQAGDGVNLEITRRNQAVVRHERSLVGDVAGPPEGRQRYHREMERAARLEAQGDFAGALEAMQAAEQSSWAPRLEPYRAECLLRQAGLLAGRLAQPVAARAVLAEARRLIAAQGVSALHGGLRSAESFVEAAMSLEVPVPTPPLPAPPLPTPPLPAPPGLGARLAAGWRWLLRRGPPRRH